MTSRLLDDVVEMRMKEIREEIDQDIEHVTESVHKMVDWKSYVAAHPWACLAAAAALGCLIAPRRSAAGNAKVATPVDSPVPAPVGPAPAVPVSPAAAESTVARGLFDAFVSTVVSVTIREAIVYFGPRVEALLAKQVHGKRDDNEPA